MRTDDDIEGNEYGVDSEYIETKIQRVAVHWQTRKERAVDKREWTDECNKKKKYSIGKTIELILNFWIRSIVNVNSCDDDLKLIMSNYVVIKTTSFHSTYKSINVNEILNLMESRQYAWINIDMKCRIRQMISKYDEPKDFLLSSDFIKNFTTNKNGNKLILMSLYDTNTIIILPAMHVYCTDDNIFFGKIHEKTIKLAQNIYDTYIANQRIEKTENYWQYKIDYMTDNGWHTQSDQSCKLFADLNYDKIVKQIKYIRTKWLKSR